MSIITDLEWSGEANVTVDGFDYHCELDVDVQCYDNGLEHDYIVTLGEFECYNPGSQLVINPALRRKVRMALYEWIDEHKERIIKAAK